ncbi:MAG: von Willebrand factor type A domain-containing protein [Sediminibacterium sp.]
MKRIIFFSFLLLIIATAFTYSTRIITGTITDDAGKPVIAYIQVKNSKKGTNSAADGSFKLEITDDKTILVVGAVGFETKEIPVGGDDKLTIRLKAITQTLNEVVVVKGKVAAGAERTMKKDNISYPGPPQLNNYSAGNNAAALQSRVGALNIGGYEKKSQIFYDRDIRYFDQKKYFDREGYDHITENPFLTVTDNPLSTFSIDVDAASYSNVRRILKSGQLPQEGAIRIEEMINYFSYQYAQPTGKDPFAVHTELAVCPWNVNHQLVLIGLQGKKIETNQLRAGNFTFLIDVSGSMMSPDKLPLVQSSLKLLVDQLREADKVSIVVYAGNAGLVLPPTSGDRKITIKEAIDRLQAGGSTAGGAGIELAYKVARQNFNKEGNNRVILCTDGDFNVGQSSDDALEKMIENERKTGVYLTVLGYGTGNYQDAKMQKLADKGNGNHAYIDGISEAKKVLVNEFAGTMFTIAKDVKLQIEFNPAKVKGYRLIGYENRMLAKEDFNDDKKDAGELGSGHTVTALYEVIPVGVESEFLKSVDSLKYQKNVVPLSKSSQTDEILTVKFRYKAPDGDVSKLIEHPVKDKQISIAKTSDNFRFAASVAQFGMLLRNSEFKSDASYADVLNLARKAKGNDDEGYRSEFIRLAESAQMLAKTTPEPKKNVGVGGDEETESKQISKNK